MCQYSPKCPTKRHRKAEACKFGNQSSMSRTKLAVRVPAGKTEAEVIAEIENCEHSNITYEEGVYGCTDCGTINPTSLGLV